MDGEWDEVAKAALPPPGVRAILTPIATMAFDTSQELFWVGNEYGRVTSFYGTALQRYTSFRAHPSADGPVRQLLFHDKGVIALGSRSVHMASRKGPPIWNITHEDMKDLRCMSFTSKGTSEILVAGVQDQMFTIDVNRGEISKTIPSSDHYMIMRRCRYICGATNKGWINIIDPISFNVIKKWTAHTSLINDMDAQHDYIVTCGYSLRHQGNYMLEPLVNVFDLRNMIQLPPIPFPSGAAYVRMHPRMSTTCIIVSQLGQMHVADFMNVHTSNVRQANVTSFIGAMEIAPSGEAIALGDAECNIHLWGSPSKIRFAELSNPIEFADAEPEYPSHVDWTSETPMNTIGMPYYREQLLSSWPSHMIFEVGAPPPKPDPQFMLTLKNTDWGGYARNTKTGRRNQVENTRMADKGIASLQAPKFLSEKARESANSVNMERRISDVADALGVAELSSLKAEVPVIYRNVEIKYSKFGVDDFDFGFYNKTSYSGLEIHISNSYANPLLQVLHFTPLVRNMALHHAATSCINDLCLLCEMGYLFDMLEKAEGSICQATNLLKTFGNHPQAGPLGLLEEDSPGLPLTSMLQGLNRFLAEKLIQDYRSIAPYSNAFEQVLATNATTTIRCMNCRSEHTRPGTTFVNDLMYPATKPANRGPRLQKLTFSQILKSSVERETTSRGWCSRCQRYQSLATRRTIHSVPAVMMLNAAIASPEAKQLWGTPGWLPDEIGIIIDQGQFFCYEGDDLKFHLQRATHNVTVYSLIGIAADIDSGQHQKSHLVSLVNVAHSEPTVPTESKWHLFNDFLVRPIKKEDALTFNSTWKLPSVITFQIKTENNHIDNRWKKNLDCTLLYMDHNPNPIKTYRPLTFPDETPGEGTIIALDTEFVAVRQPEIEMNSDGERETIRPIVYSLARVSVVRGSGFEEGTPFIDDYIISREPVIDYLTNFSGIVPGDLDPKQSRHNLISLKMAYKKLWILLNLGCKFLGHGLKQDFRVINIHIPKSQTIDTIDKFFLPERLRKLSLAFLAWHFLKEDIQLETHDSIEDARTALKLYRKYEEFKDAGVVQPKLDEVYAVGSKYGFKAPKVHGAPSEVIRTDTPPPMAQVDGEAPNTPLRAHATFGQISWTPGKGSPLR